MKHKLFLLLVMVVIAPFAIHSGRGQAAERDELVLAIHPYLPAVELHKRFSPLVHYLEGKTGETIRIEISSDFKTHIQKVGEDRADFAFMGPAHYVVMSKKYERKVLLAGLEVNGASLLHVIFIVRNDSPIASLADLTGKKVAFTGPSAATGHLIVPNYMLEQAGVRMDTLAQSSFLGSHNNVAMAVLGGYFDAGAVKEEVYGKFQERGLRMLAQSPTVPEQLFVASTKLSPRLTEILRTSLLGLKKAPEGKAILESIQEFTTALVPVKESDFDEMRKMLSQSLDGGS